MHINACEMPRVPLVVSLAPHCLILGVGQAELANIAAVHVVVEGDRGDEPGLLVAHCAVVCEGKEVASP